MISVVTVTLNNLDGLQRTSSSLLNQTSRDFEWLVVDGGSSDGTGDWLQNFPAETVRLRWLSEPDEGLYDAMNKGLNMAHGEYVLFLNAGDELASEVVLERAASALAKADADLAYGDSYDRLSDGRVLYRRARSHAWLPFGMFTQHQAMIFRVDRSRLRYSLNYELSADYAFVGEFLADSSTLAVYLPFPICLFESGGLSQRKRWHALIEDRAIRQRVMGMGRIRSTALMVAHALHYLVLKRLFAPIYNAYRYRKER